MRQEFISQAEVDQYLAQHDQMDVAMALDVMVPWAAIVADVEGGWHAYESVDDYKIAEQQQ